MPNKILFPVFVDTQAPITINAQVAEQIKLLIAVGELQPGDTLPTVTQLAQHLKLNHNTIAAIYNYLIESGYLVAQRGKGTFVADTQAVQNIIIYKEFYNLLSQAFNAAVVTGLSPSEFGAAAYAQAALLHHHITSPIKLVFIEYLQHSTGVCEAIQLELRLPVLSLCSEDLKANQSKALKELLSADLVITTAHHQWDVTRLTTPEQEIIAVSLKPDLQLLAQISSLPRNALILLIGQDEASCEEMKQMLQQAGISHINFQTLSLNYLQQNLEVLKQADAVCASRLIENYVRENSPQPSEVMIFNFSLDEANMSVLKARLAAIQLAKSTISHTNQ